MDQGKSAATVAAAAAATVTAAQTLARNGKIREMESLDLGSVSHTLHSFPPTPAQTARRCSMDQFLELRFRS